jgi:hypothetical protein
MAVKKTGDIEKPIAVKKRTSIGSSAFSRPTNKHKKKNYSKYRGQGR